MGNKLLFAGTLLALAVVGVAMFVEQGGRPSADRPQAVADSTRLVRPHSPTLGRADAKVQLVEFLDPACSTCALFYPEVKRMLAANPDRIRLVIRHVPFHQGSDAVVRMLEAARMQGKYWEALETLLAAQGRWVRDHRVDVDAAMVVLAAVPGLDAARLGADRERPEIRDRVAQDLADAKALKVVKTPEFFVNGRPLPSFGLEELRGMVDAALRAAG